VLGIRQGTGRFGASGESGMKTNKSDQSEGKDRVVNVALVEYSAMRQRIADYQGERNSFVNYTLLLTLGALSAGGTPIYTKFPSILLYLPFLYFVLAMLHLDRTLRIKRSADYLHNHIRPLLARNLGQDILAYDIYKSTIRQGSLRLMAAIDRTRWILFLGPMIGSVYAFIRLQGFPMGHWMLLAVVGVDCALCVLLLIAAHYGEDTQPPKSRRRKK